MEEKDFIDILWKYFELHSNQRMQMINFSLVVHSLLITVLIGLFTSNSAVDLTQYKILVCISLIVFSFIFYMLDRRTKEMIKNCEESLKAVEQKYASEVDENFLIFTMEEGKTKNSWTLSYTKSLSLGYLFFVIFAIVCLLIIA